MQGNLTRKPPLRRYAVVVAALPTDGRARNGSRATTEGAPLKAQDHIAYMELALKEARAAAAKGEVPVGAVVVHEPYDAATRRPLTPPRVVGVAHNLRESSNDASAHAEFLAMRQAMAELKSWRLVDCTVYVTLEPCLMCAGLMQQARVSKCVFGAADPKGGALGSLYSLNDDDRLNHSFEVVTGVCEDECSQVLKDFFKERRKK